MGWLSLIWSLISFLWGRKKPSEGERLGQAETAAKTQENVIDDVQKAHNAEIANDAVTLDSMRVQFARFKRPIQ